MVKYLIFLLVALGLYGQGTRQLLTSVNGSSGGASCGGTYSHCATVVIPSQSSTLTDFPVEIAGVSQWAVVGSGGQVVNTVAQSGGGLALTVPADLIVTTDTCTTKVPFEWEVYNSTTGTGSVLWAKATLSSGGSTTLYVCWGAGAVTTWQGDVPGTWNSNYVSVEHMSDNAANTTVADSSSTAQNFINAANTSGKTTTGQVGNALTFNGSSDTAGANNATLRQSVFTFAAWINLSGSGTRTIFGSSDTGGNPQFRINGTLDLLKQGVADLGNGSTTLSNSTWYHVAVSYDGSGNFAFYVNGASDGTGTNLVTFTPATTVNLGSTSGEFFSGTMDEFEFSKSVRSADWIAAEYNNQHAPASWYTFSIVL